MIRYEFFCETKTLHTARNLNSVYGSSVTMQHMLSNWSAEFCTGNFDLKCEQSDSLESRENHEEVKGTVESDPSHSDYALLLKFR